MFNWLKKLFALLFKSPDKTPMIDAPYTNKKWDIRYDKAIDLAMKKHLPCPPVPCGNFVNFIKALATAESGLDYEQVYKEPDSIGGMNSIGLLQLSVNDVKNYKSDLKIYSEDDLKDPIKNLSLGVEIICKLHHQMPSKTVYETSGRYFSVLRWDKYWPTRKQDGFERFKKALGCSELDYLKPNPNAEPLWLQVARDELGEHEIAGSKDNPRIVEYHNYTSLDASDDETSWCSSFVNYCMARAGQKRTNSAMAKSWLKWGVPLAEPRLGCVVVMWRGSPSLSTGHVGFWLSEDKDTFKMLGGNQSDQVSIATQPKSRILAYRWPS